MNQHDQTQLAITAAVTLIWLVCVIVCFLKWKTWTAIFGIIGLILGNIPIGGTYLHYLVMGPATTLGLLVVAIRLAKPVSWWAKWFYWGPFGSDRRLRRPSPKLAKALARFPEERTDFEQPESPPPPQPPPTSECEEIATAINRLVKSGYIAKAQELLELSLDDYFVLQLAMFADKNVNAYTTIAAWKQAGLRLPAEDTAEFYPYGDSPSIAEEQSRAEAPTSKSRGDEPVKVGKPINWREVKFANDEAQYGAFLIRKGIRDYRSWGEWMALNYGESVRENLSSIYSEAETRAAAVDAMEQESRELLGPSVWRSLENAGWSSDAVREDAMLPLRIAYNDLSNWHARQLKSVVEAITVLTVNRIFAEMKPLPEKIRSKFQDVTTPTQASEVADEATSAALAEAKATKVSFLDELLATRTATSQISWAAAEAGWGAIRAAWALAELASAGAKAADAASKWGADPDDILRKVCQIWIEAARA